MKTDNKMRKPGENEASDSEKDDDKMLDHPGQPAGNHGGSPVGSRGDNKRRHSGKESIGGSRTSKK